MDVTGDATKGATKGRTDRHVGTSGPLVKPPMGPSWTEEGRPPGGPVTAPTEAA